MKSTGIVRRIDELGRVVLPIELRRAIDIEERDPLEITLDGDCILLRKYQPTCVFCNAEEDLLEYRSKRICRHCLATITTLDD